MKRVFSGIQPTGNIHIGNYLGGAEAVRRIAGQQRLHLLYRGSAFDYSTAGSEKTQRKHTQRGGSLSGGGRGSKKIDGICTVRCSRTFRAVLDFDMLLLYGGTVENDTV